MLQASHPTHHARHPHGRVWNSTFAAAHRGGCISWEPIANASALFHGQRAWPACEGAELGKPLPALHARLGRTPLSGEAPATLALDVRRHGADTSAGFQPAITILMNLHNAQHSLQHSLPRLLNLTASCSELIMLLDHCTDDSYGVIARLLSAHFASPPSLRWGGLARARVLEQRTPVWEAAGESILMSVTDPSLAYILVQPDNLIYEVGWDLQLARPLHDFADTFAVSGFLAHAFGSAKSGEVHKALKWRHGLRLNGSVVAGIGHGSTDRDVFYVRETCSRGPMLLHAKRAQELRFFDFENHWMDDADHELNCRATLRHGWAAGYVAIDARDVRSLGTRFRPEPSAESKNQSQTFLHQMRVRQRTTMKKSCLIQEAHGLHEKPPRIEDRRLTRGDERQLHPAAVCAASHRHHSIDTLRSATNVVVPWARPGPRDVTEASDAEMADARWDHERETRAPAASDVKKAL